MRFVVDNDDRETEVRLKFNFQGNGAEVSEIAFRDDEGGEWRVLTSDGALFAQAHVFEAAAFAVYKLINEDLAKGDA